jgi:acetate kinase
VAAQHPKCILTMNRGSATLKAALFEAENRNELLLSMTVDRAGASGDQLKIADPSGTTLLDSPVDGGDSDAALEAMFAWLGEHEFLAQLTAAGHRLVQGGTRYMEPQRINPEFMKEMEQIAALDPDHMPAAIRGIQFVERKLPKLPQVACFDTAFHRSLPEVARMYALPRRLYDQGIHRYGFHGLSYEYIMGELHALDEKLVNGRVIIAHLGSGASMVAVKAGKSIDTSMGFTPLEGLVMATRSGDVDPGLLVYLLTHEKMSPKEISKLLNKESGLLGVSGATADMRDLLDRASRDAHAAEAIDLFCYRAKKYIGAYAAALGGLDVLVFTGGIGERAPAIRERICDGLDFLGIHLDATRNAANTSLISSASGADSRVHVRVMKTNEDWMIVHHVIQVLGQPTPKTN